MRNYINILLFILISGACFAQDYPLTGHFQNLYEKDVYYNDISNLIRPTTGVENNRYDSLIFSSKKIENTSWLKRKIFSEHLIEQEQDKFKLFLDPIFDLRVNKNIGNSNSNNSLGFLNTRGVLLQGKLASKIFFNTSFYENQGVFSTDIDSYYNDYGVIPGYGRIKKNTNNKVYDFSAAYGNISLKLIEELNFTLGYDRLFIGEGYRSLFLSDYAAPMMYFKLNLKLGKFEYNSIFTKALNPNYNNVMGYLQTGSVNSKYPHKFISFNTLTYKHKEWQFTLLDALVIANNVPYFKTFLYTGSPFVRLSYIDFTKQKTNSLSGVNISWQNKKIGILYSQIVLNNIYNGDFEHGIQLGYKSFDFIGVNNLYFQLEYNRASEKMYAFKNNDLHYGHYNQTLAHPAGAGFNETLLIIAYKIKRFEVLMKSSWLKYYHYKNYDHKNIFDYSSTTYNTAYSGKPNYLFGEMQFIYNINKANKLQVFTAISSKTDIITKSHNIFMQAGIRTCIRSNYYDF